MFNAMSGGFPSLADIAAVTRGNGDDGFGGNNGWWILIILFAIFGGWGNNGNNRNAGAEQASAGYLGAEVQRGFDTQSVVQKLDGLNNGLCSLGYDQLAQMNGIQQSISQGNFGLQNSIQQQTITQMQDTNALSRQLADCCCENRSAIAQVRYDMATDTCAITNAIRQASQDQIQNCNANYRQLHDEIVDLRIQDMRDQLAQKDSMISALNLSISQSNQSSNIVDQVVSQLRNCPVGTYNVPNPNWVLYPNNGCSGCNSCNGFNN